MSGIMTENDGYLDDPKVTLANVKERYDAAYSAYRAFHMLWLVNISFYLGKQNVFFSSLDDRLAQVPVPIQPRHRKLEIRNRIAPSADMWVSMLTDVNPAFRAVAGSNDESDLLAARGATRALQDTAWRVQLDTRELELAKWLVLCGTAYMLPRFDPSLGPDGDFDLEIVSPFDAYAELGATDPRRCGHMIRVHSFAVDDAKMRFPHVADKLQADSGWNIDKYSGELLQRLSGINTSQSNSKNRCLVYEMWEKPNAKWKEGRHVICTSTVVITDETWPSQRYPLIRVLQSVVPGRWHGRTWLSDTIMAQQADNRMVSQFVEHLTQATSPVVFEPIGANIRQDAFSGEMMERIQYNQNQGGPPTFAIPPGVPPHLFDFSEKQRAYYEDASGVHAASLGQRVPGARSARTLAYLQQSDNRSLTQAIKYLAQGLSELGKSYLEMWHAFVPFPRAVQYLGPSGRYETEQFYAANIDGWDVRVEFDTLMPRNRAIVEDAVRTDFGLGIITREEARRALAKDSDSPELYEGSEDRARARDEWEWLAQGIPVSVEDIEDHEIHWQQHRLDAIVGGFYNAPPEVQQVIRQHISDHAIRIQSAQQSQTAPPQGKQLPAGSAPELSGGGGMNAGVDLGEETAIGIGG